MLHIRRVVGHSMEPTLTEGSIVCFINKGTITSNSIVLAKIKDREVVKRVVASGGGTFELRGDNATQSTDSRHYGSVDRRDIKGVLLTILVKK